MSGLVGIPFVDGGRTREGCDCWGLVRLVFAERAAIELPGYGEIGAEELLRVARKMEAATSDDETWRRIDGEPRRALDVVTMKQLQSAKAVPIHVGVMLDDRRMLHTVRAADSHVVPIDHASVRTRIIGFYRHRDLS